MMKSVLFLLFVVFATNVKTEGGEQASDKDFKCYIGNEMSLNSETSDCNTAKGEVCFKASLVMNGDKIQMQECKPQEIIYLYQQGSKNFEACNSDYCNKIDKSE